MPPRVTVYDLLSRVTFTESCWLVSGSEDGGGYVNFGDTKAHRASWEFFNGPVPDGLYVLHECDVRRCCNPEHLWLGSAKDNVRDMIAKGRRVIRPARGERHFAAKLTEEDVKEIRASELRSKDLAAAYGVARTTINGVRSRYTWRHI